MFSRRTVILLGTLLVAGFHKCDCLVAFLFGGHTDRLLGSLGSVAVLVLVDASELFLVLEQEGQLGRHGQSVLVDSLLHLGLLELFLLLLVLGHPSLLEVP